MPGGYWEQIIVWHAALPENSWYSRQRPILFAGLSIRRKEKCCMHPMFWLLVGCLMDWLLPYLFQIIDGTWHTLVTSRLLRTIKNWVACCCFRGPIVQQKITKSKRLSSWNKKATNHQIPLIRNLKTQIQIRHIHRKIWEAPRFSGWADL